MNELSNLAIKSDAFEADIPKTYTVWAILRSLGIIKYQTEVLERQIGTENAYLTPGAIADIREQTKNVKRLLSGKVEEINKAAEDWRLHHPKEPFITRLKARVGLPSRAAKTRQKASVSIDI